MKKSKIYLLIILVFAASLDMIAQVAINTDGSSPTTGTILDIKSSALVKQHIVIQDATGYMGVGTTNPQKRLDVWGTIRGSIDSNNYVDITAEPILTGPLSGTLEGLLRITGPATQRYSFVFKDGSVTDTILSLVRPTGSIGIGTTAPVGKLHVSVSDTDMTNNIASMGIETGGFQSWLGMALENQTLPGNPEPFIGYGPFTESLKIVQIDPNNLSEMRMFFHPLGPVGIGDPSNNLLPTAALQVSNRGDVYPILNLMDDDVNVMTVLDGGNVGIGVTSPSSKLQVAGDIYATSDITTDTDVWSDNVYALSNIESGAVVQVGTEVNRTAQGTADLIPIAYGVVDGSNGNILSGSGNFSVSHSGTGVYSIVITGETFNSNDFTTNATAKNTSPIIVTIGDSSGNLIVRTWNSSGSASDSDFHFVVFKP